MPLLIRRHFLFAIAALTLTVGGSLLSWATRTNAGAAQPVRMHVAESAAPVSVAPAPPETGLAQDLVVLVQQESPAAAFALLRKERARNAQVAIDCHDYSHVIGTAAYAKYGTFAAAMPFASDLCGSGYIHSLLVEMLRSTDDPKAAIAHVCDGMDGFCLHGIGHGLMFYTSHDVPASLALCATFADGGHAARCSEGVFMQNFDHHGRHENPYFYEDDPLRLCREETRFKPACYHYAGTYLAVDWRKAKDVFSRCNAADAAYVAKCVSGMGAHLMAVHLQNPIASLEVCKTANDAATRAACIDGLVSYHLVNFGSAPETEAFCAKMEGEDRASCAAAFGSRRAEYE